MRLQRLTVHGFKSFADKTDFEFVDGLTGIIGPNGCGKSNVVDAMKWVLGDQRPTSQRGKEMLDVVFHGAEGRPAMGCAQVTLVLEREPESEPSAAEGDEPVDASPVATAPVEMSVSRRLYRSGESEYLLDGRVVRLKDVREALMDTGLGVGGYSVMEQGRIDAVLSANPDERRSIFDEAAGISRYKLRRKEALRKLDRVELNLGRVHDLRQEKASRVRSLKIQATKARTWREAHERLMTLRVAVAVLDSIELRTALDHVDDELAEVEARLSAAETGREQARTDLESVENDARALGARHGELRELAAHLRAEERSRREALAGAERRLQELDELLERCTVEGEDTHKKLEERSAELKELLENEQRQQGLLEAALAELPTLTEAAKSARESFRTQQREDEALRERMLEVLQEKTRARNVVREEEIESGAIRARGDGLREQLADLETRLESSRLESVAQARECDDLEQRYERAGGELDRQLELIHAHAADKDALVQRSHELAREHSSLVSQLELLRDLESSHTGVDEAAKALLEREDARTGDRVLQRIVECIDCPVELGPSIEAVLGARVQALVVQDAQSVEAALAELDEHKGSRLVLVDASRLDRDEPVTDAPAPRAPTTIPPTGLPLVDFCRFHAPVAALLHECLRDVVLVPDLEAARRLEGLQCCVTPRGEYLDGAWIQAGRAEVAASLLQRRSQLEHLSHELERVEAELKVAREAESSLDEVLQQHNDQRRRLEQLAESLDRKLRAARHALESREARERELREELELRAKECARLRSERTASHARIMQPLFNLVLLDKREKFIEEQQRALRREIEDGDRLVHSTQEQLSALQTRRAGLDAELRGLQQRHALLDAGVTDLQKRSKDLETRADAARVERVDLDTERDRTRIELVDFECRARTVEEIASQAAENLAEFEVLRESHRLAVEGLDDELHEAREDRSAVWLRNKESAMQLERLENEVYAECGIELARLRGEVEGRGLWSDHEVLGPEIPRSGPVFDRIVDESLQGPPLPPDFWQRELELEHLWEADDFVREDARKESEVLRARMQRMGSVNHDAEHELEDAESQFGQLERDCVDLEKAKRELIDAIHKINLESRRLFEETFELARKNFQEIFRKLFQGGRADIELVETDDPLDAGIEILARPPGKELRSIRLLSGGERSMTALAILFAVFQIKPSPFCILDEVDAALDEANVERFLRVLHDFTQDTQFLVVTHHKRTMADCRVLYGVTMPRKGISSRMSVSLEDVESGAVDDVLENPDAHTAGVRAQPVAQAAAARRRVADERETAVEAGEQ